MLHRAGERGGRRRRGARVGWYGAGIAAPEPQPILTPITEAAIFLVLTVNAGAEEDARGERKAAAERVERPKERV